MKLVYIELCEFYCYFVFAKSCSWKKDEVLHRYFIDGYMFHIEEYGQDKRTYNGGGVKF